MFQQCKLSCVRNCDSRASQQLNYFTFPKSPDYQKVTVRNLGKYFACSYIESFVPAGRTVSRIVRTHLDHQARDLLSCVDVAIILSNGKVIAKGTPSELVNDDKAQSAYFGSSFKIN